MPATKQGLNSFGINTLVKLSAYGLTQAELAELMGVKSSNLSAAMRKKNPNALFIMKWENRVNDALKSREGAAG